MEEKEKKSNDDGEKASEETLGDYLLEKEFRRSQAIKELLKKHEPKKAD